LFASDERIFARSRRSATLRVGTQRRGDDDDDDDKVRRGRTRNMKVAERRRARETESERAQSPFVRGTRNDCCCGLGAGEIAKSVRPSTRNKRCGWLPF
jgi:hypothetical protein